MTFLIESCSCIESCLVCNAVNYVKINCEIPTIVCITDFARNDQKVFVVIIHEVFMSKKDKVTSTY